MGRQISMATRNELVAAIRDRYAAASRNEKSRILDEFTALTGYHRKHAIRVLNAAVVRSAGQRLPGRRVYDEAVRIALVAVWEAADRICGKRLKVAIPSLVQAMERHGHLDLEPTVRARLLQISPATIDRMLAPEKGRGQRRRRRGTAVGRQVPVRTFTEWADAVPGEVEADFVVHSGGSMSGSMVHSLVVTDVTSGWTECIPLLNREQSLVVAGFTILRQRMPCGIVALNTDNDSAFINEAVLAYCQAHGIQFTRSRPHRKNDQAWIEQKNGAVVRRLVGYQRIEGLRAVQVLTRLYSAARLFVNYFQPSFKLHRKTREGAKVTKRYHPPATPYARLMAHADVSAEVKATLSAIRDTLDPVHLLGVIRAAQKELVNMDAELEPVRGALTTDAFLEVVTDLWRKGEPSPKVRKKAREPRAWRTRKDPFDEHWPEIVGWLEREPDLTAREALERLIGRAAEGLSQRQLRTLQRRFQAWRSARAHALVRAVG